MFIGVYLLLKALVFAFILLSRFKSRSVSRQADHTHGWLRLFAGYALLLSLLSLVAFIFLSVWSGIIAIGTSSSYSIPQDYISFGVLGWFVLAIGFIGVLSPLLAAWIADKKISGV